MTAACDIAPQHPTGAQELRLFAGFVGLFALLFFLPGEILRSDNALSEGFQLTKWYAREHILLCLVPALFIAGGISVFVNQASVMHYLGPRAPKPLAYAIASVSGTVLAVCSCTVLPLFGGIWRRGAGLGPATAFLYAGPAVNVLALVMSARILGIELGLARALGAVVFSVAIGLIMHQIFRQEEQAKAEAAVAMPEPETRRPLGQVVLFFALMVGVLVLANWGEPTESNGLWAAIFAWRWPGTAALAVGFGATLGLWFGFDWRGLGWTALAVVVVSLLLPGAPSAAFTVGCAGLALLCARHPSEGREWLLATWTLTKQILPLLVVGVFVAGLLLGRPGHEALIPAVWVSQSVGGNSIGANLFASVVGAFMYFATLTEVPILQGLIGSGMGKGPALALLLAGPALSLPSILVLRSILGTRKLAAYVALVVVMSTLTGLLYGALF